MDTQYCSLFYQPSDFFDLSIIFLLLETSFVRFYYSFRFPYGSFEKIIKIFPILNKIVFKKEKTEPPTKNNEDKFVEPTWSLFFLTIQFHLSSIILFGYYRIDKLFIYIPLLLNSRFYELVIQFCGFIICQGDITIIYRDSRMGILFRIFGLILFQSSILLFTWVHKVMRTNWTPVVVVRKDHTLVTSGPFQYVRHPMYLSAFLMGLGTGLLSWNWILCLVGLLSLFVFSLSRIPIEDKLLLNTFGNQYSKYSSKVKYAIIPYIY